MADCASCRFFDPVIVHDSNEPDAESGPETICRRYPPFGDGWPTVLADDWCGEWSAA